MKDRRGKSDREWEGLAEEENLMGKSECSGGRVVVSLTYLLCATHETFSCSSRFLLHHLSSPLLLSLASLPLSPTPGYLSIVFPVLWLACWMFHEGFFFPPFLKTRALSIWSTLIKYKHEFTWEPVQQELVSPNMLLLRKKNLMECRQQKSQYRLGLRCRWGPKKIDRDGRLGRESHWWL